ncbi:MAG: acyl-CoA/acyl-ACP dehydrogenase [Bdellovibrionales bacterium]|nr:acyl-CoA/acyl-ACP dehydrogenase [Bdellovibrionales bacterium]
MSLNLTEEQQELQSTLKRFFEDTITSEYLRRRLESNDELDESLLASFQELGLFSYFGESEGEGQFLTLSLIAKLGGRVLLTEPLPSWIFASSYLAGNLLASSSHIKDAFGESEVAALLSGDILYVPLSVGAASSLSFQEAKGEVTVNGTASYLSGCSRAKRLLLLSRDGVFITRGELGAAGITAALHSERLDRTMVRHAVSFESAPLLPLPLSSERLLPLPRILCAQELAGMSARVVEMTVEYVSTRKQFDVPVGGFQAVQQKLADMHAESEALQALAHFAAWTADYSQDQLELASQTAILKAVSVVPKIIETAIQLHGGIGFTWEHDLHLYLRRAQTLSALWAPSEADYDSLLAAAE